MCFHSQFNTTSLPILALILGLDKTPRPQIPASDLFRLFTATSRITPDAQLYFVFKEMIENEEVDIDEAIATCQEIHRCIKEGQKLLVQQNDDDFWAFFKD